jgi:hypothetical protein
VHTFGRLVGRGRTGGVFFFFIVKLLFWVGHCKNFINGLNQVTKIIAQQISATRAEMIIDRV